jgi:hypothetical protein
MGPVRHVLMWTRVMAFCLLLLLLLLLGRHVGRLFVRENNLENGSGGFVFCFIRPTDHPRYRISDTADKNYFKYIPVKLPFISFCHYSKNLGTEIHKELLLE